MRKLLLMLSALMLALALSSSALAAVVGETVDGVFDSPDREAKRQAAEAAIKEQYPFDSSLYTCLLHVGGSQNVLEYRLQQSDMAIFFVEVGADKLSPCRVAYNSTYTLEHYYDDLANQRGAIFRSWSVEDKYWFAQRLPALIELDNFRSASVYPEYKLPPNAFAQSILAYKHGLPDERAISEESARQIALDWMKQNPENTAETLNSLIFSTYYLLDEPEGPRWYFRVFDHSAELYTISINAYTGEIMVAVDMRKTNG